LLDNLSLTPFRITSVVVDEAGAVSEWQAALIGVLPMVKRIICIGDINQLPPFTHLTQDFPCSFLERAQRRLEKVKKAIPMLTVRYNINSQLFRLKLICK
jgi:ATP-dependent exoDNAse (exonuclease V) alpha subunit